MASCGRDGIPQGDWIAIDRIFCHKGTMLTETPMRISEQTPVQFRDDLPEAVDVAIIGAGVIGMATAWFLARAGVSVLVCEKGRVAGEQSSRNWGWVRQQGRDAAELPIMMHSIGLWEGLEQALGESVGFARGGCLFLAERESEVAELEDFLDLAKDHDLDSRLINGCEVDALLDSRPGQWCAALYTPSDGRAEPFIAVPALARGVQRAGGRVREACAVRALDMEAGRVRGLVTEDGRVRAQQVVCAAGAWSSVFCRHHGLELPQLTVKSTVCRTSAAPEIFPGEGCGNDLAFRRRADGGYTLALINLWEHFVGRDSFRYLREFLPLLWTSRSHTRVRFGDGLMDRLAGHGAWNGDQESPFERTRVLDPAPGKDALKRIRRLIPQRFPALESVSLVEGWAGMVDAMPDAVPVMDRVETLPGLFLSTGFSGHGFGIGMGAGHVMARMLQGKEPQFDLSRFRYTRFSDGSRLELGPSI